MTWKLWFVLLAAALSQSGGAAAFAFETSTVAFNALPTNLPDVAFGSAAWGDYDADGDLDFVLSGQGQQDVPLCVVYRNDGNDVFSNVYAGLPGVVQGSVAWGDYDNDGDLDLLLTGNTQPGLISRLYRNDEGVFSDIDAGLPGVYESAVAWADVDNDGRLDFLITGDTGSGDLSRVYHNDGNGVFSDIGAGLPPVSSGSVAWADYDTDGDLDILLNGAGPTRLYRNDGNGSFANTNIPFMGLHWGSADWGDYDNDGDLDVLLTGENQDPGTWTLLYRNNGNDDFDLIYPTLVPVMWSSAAWADFDHDGLQDVLLTGTPNGMGTRAIVYRNNGDATWSDYSAGLIPVKHGAALWGDYDNDGDLDILLHGSGGVEFESIALIYRSDGGEANLPPAAPTGLTAQQDGEWVVFSWDSSSDDRTPPASLTYNLRIGITPGGGELLSPMAGSQGTRRVVRLGNTNLCRSWRIRLEPGLHPCYWSVQAIDGAYAGSPFAEEQIVSGVTEEGEHGQAALLSASPNPFSGATFIGYPRAPEEAGPPVILDSAGRLVRILEKGANRADPMTVTWDGRDGTGRRVASGVYYFRLAGPGPNRSLSVVHVR